MIKWYFYVLFKTLKVKGVPQVSQGFGEGSIQAVTLLTVPASAPFYGCPDASPLRTVLDRAE